jgi:hypothetical protein
MRLAVLTLAFGVACSGSLTPSVDAGPGAVHDAGNRTISTPCTYDDECAAGLICASGICQPGSGCDQDFHCAGCDLATCGFDGRGYCKDAVCRRARPLCATCAEASQCGEETASGRSNLCTPLGDRSVCALDASRRSCPAGMSANPAGACLPNDLSQCGIAPSCVAAHDCPSERRCAQRDDDPGLCLEVCARDDECPTGSICDTFAGACRENCQERGCAANQVCHDTGHCGEACAADGDCPEGFSCLDGACRLPGCSSDRDCPPIFGVYCDIDTRACVEGCRDDEHCSATQVCRDGDCVARPCRGKELDCGLGEFCCGRGAYADDCPAEVATGACFPFPDGFCQPCSEADDCPGPRHGTDSLCVTYNDADDRELGKACALGCRDLEDCPRGFSCVEVRDGDDQVVGNVCAAAMCVTGTLERR